jgi:hypothetical protein
MRHMGGTWPSWSSSSSSSSSRMQLLNPPQVSRDCCY